MGAYAIGLGHFAKNRARWLGAATQLIVRRMVAAYVGHRELAAGDVDFLVIMKRRERRLGP